MTTIEEIEMYIANAEKARWFEEQQIELGAAKNVLVDAVLRKESIDKERLLAIVKKCGENVDRHGKKKEGANVIVWANFGGCCAEYLESGGVPMRDGRVATSIGWNYENCEPVEIHARISRAACERLEAYVNEITKVEPGIDPLGRSGKNRTEYDDIHDKILEKAINEYLDHRAQ